MDVSNFDCRSIFDKFKYFIISTVFFKIKQKEKMAIQWTPWFNVPTTKRLELLSIGFLIFCTFGLLPIFIMVMLYILVTKFDDNGIHLSFVRSFHCISFSFADSTLETFICEPFVCCIWDFCTMIESRVIVVDVVLGNYIYKRIVSSKYDAIF